VTAFAAVAEPSRRRILDLLRERERPVGELVDDLRVSQPAVSKHLRILRDEGLVDVRPQGRSRLYALRAAPLAEVDAWLDPYRKHWIERLNALEQHLEDNP
jgi:DNA-binding transcriptional ArsR family regulator